MSLDRIIISGGGTGGHIFPAISIANRIKFENPDAEILFIGAEGKMEMEKVPEAGYKIEGLWISGFQRRFTVKNLLLPFKIIASLIKAIKIIKQFKPQAVVGVGGYASGPSLKIASLLRVSTVLQEQNSYPGKTNKILAKSATKICVAYDNLDRFFPKDKIVLTGNPVRQSVVKTEGLRQKALTHFGLTDGQKTLLVVGGSLGAKTLNDSLKKDLEKLQNEGIQVIWQCGNYQADELKSWKKQVDMKGVSLHIFIREMELAYAAADIIISRAGAIALSELSIIAKPIILVPSPNVAEDHQTKNAMALVDKNAAVMITDMRAREDLIPAVIGLFKNQDGQQELREKLEGLAIHNADERIVNVIKSIVK